MKPVLLSDRYLLKFVYVVITKYTHCFSKNKTPSNTTNHHIKKIYIFKVPD